MRNLFFLLTLSAFVMSLGGCAGRSDSQLFVREGIDIGFYQKIAILPFNNNTDNKFASQRARDLTATTVLAMGLFDIVDNGVVDSVLKGEAVDKDANFDAATLERLGQVMEVQAFLLGTVEMFKSSRSGSFDYPEISITLRLLDAKGAKVIWQSAGYRSGYTISGRLLGLAPLDEYQVVSALVRDLLSGLGR